MIELRLLAKQKPLLSQGFQSFMAGIAVAIEGSFTTTTGGASPPSSSPFQGPASSSSTAQGGQQQQNGFNNNNSSNNLNGIGKDSLFGGRGASSGVGTPFTPNLGGIGKTAGLFPGVAGKFKDPNSNINMNSNNMMGTSGGVGGGSATDSKLPDFSRQSMVQVKVAQNIIKERTLLHRVRGIFAKVSHDNFKDVKEELCALPIRQSRDEDVREIVHWIYDKAVQPEDEIFVELYANLIKELTSDIQGKDPKKSSALRKALVEKCQQSFDKRTDVNKASADKISSEANAETTVQSRDSAATVALKELIANDNDSDYVKNRERSRLRSNIKFLAQLFRVQMVTVKVVNYVLYSLLYGNANEKRHKPEEYEIEMFCDLIKNTQKLLPPDVRTQYLPKYMDTVKEYTKNPKTTMRVKCLLLDLIELYDNNWEDRETRRKKGQVVTSAALPMPIPTPVSTPIVPGTTSQGGAYRPPGAHHQQSTSNVSGYEGTPTPPYSPVVATHPPAYPGANGGRGSGGAGGRGGRGAGLGGSSGLPTPVSQQQPPPPPPNANKETFILLMEKYKTKEVGAKEINDHFALLTGPFAHLKMEHLCHWILKCIKMVRKNEDRKLVCEILSILIESKQCKPTIGCELMNQLAPLIPLEIEDSPMIFSTWAELLQMKYASIIPPASHSVLLRELIKDDNVPFSEIDRMLHDVSPSASWTFTNPADAALSRFRMLPLILNCARESDDGLDDFGMDGNGAAGGGSSMLSDRGGSSVLSNANDDAANGGAVIIPPRRQDLLGYLLTHPEHPRVDTTSAIDVELDIFGILTNVENTTPQQNFLQVTRKAKSHSQRSDASFCAGFFCAIFCYLRLALATGERTDFDKIREILTLLKVPGENSQLFLRELYMTYAELGAVPHGVFQTMTEIFSPGKDAKDSVNEWKTFSEWKSRNQYAIQYIVGRHTIPKAPRGYGENNKY